MSLEGNLRARMGDYTTGLELVRAALALALENNLEWSGAEAYQRLADSLEQSGDYPAARQTYLDAADFCHTQGAEAVALLCQACMTAVLRQTGEWDRCMEVCREVLSAAASTAHARAAAHGMMGLVHAQRGEAHRARAVLLDAEREARHIELGPVEILSAWGLAMVDDLEGRTDRAIERCRELLDHWAKTEERHYAIPAFRWAASLLAAHRADAELRLCANALAQIVAETGTAESVAALGHALGEVCLVDGSTSQSRHTSINPSSSWSRWSCHTSARTPRCAWARAGRGRRTGRGHRASGRRLSACTQSRRAAADDDCRARVRGHRRAGEQRLGLRAVGLMERGGLTRREVEVLRLVANGHPTARSPTCWC